MIALGLFVYLAPLIFMLLIGETIDLRKLVVYHVILFTVAAPTVIMALAVDQGWGKSESAVVAASLVMLGLAVIGRMGK